MNHIFDTTLVIYIVMAVLVGIGVFANTDDVWKSVILGLLWPLCLATVIADHV